MPSFSNANQVHNGHAKILSDVEITHRFTLKPSEYAEFTSYDGLNFPKILWVKSTSFSMLRIK